MTTTASAPPIMLILGPSEFSFKAAEGLRQKAVHTGLGAFVTPVVDQGFGRTFDARDLDGHHLVVYMPCPGSRRPTSTARPPPSPAS